MTNTENQILKWNLFKWSSRQTAPVKPGIYMTDMGWKFGPGEIDNKTTKL